MHMNVTGTYKFWNKHIWIIGGDTTMFWYVCVEERVPGALDLIPPVEETLLFVSCPCLLLALFALHGEKFPKRRLSV